MGAKGVHFRVSRTTVRHRQNIWRKHYQTKVNASFSVSIESDIIGLKLKEKGNRYVNRCNTEYVYRDLYVLWSH